MEQSSPTPYLFLTMSSNPAKEVRVLFCSSLGEFEIWLKYTGAIYVQGEGQEEEKQEVNLE